MNDSYRKKREEGLNEARERGGAIFLDSDNPLSYASETAELGLNYREDLQLLADSNAEREAARFIGYEITQTARQEGLNTLMDQDIEMEEFWEFSLSNTPIVSLFKGFSMMDRTQGGYRDFLPTEINEHSGRQSERFPKWETMTGDEEATKIFEEYKEDIYTEVNDFDGDWFGRHLQRGILVINSDWIAYIDQKYEFPEEHYEYDRDMEEVWEILDNLGVAK